MVSKWASRAAICVTSTLLPVTVMAQSTYGIDLRATVPVHCVVSHRTAPPGSLVGEAVNLGTVSEYCNAPKGYRLVVSYAPGSLQGARLSVGNDRVSLDGSGLAILSSSNWPRIRERQLFIEAGPGGFDAAHLEFDIVPL